MKHALIALTVALGCSPALAEDFKPFGVQLGAPIAEITSHQGNGEGLYVLTGNEVPTRNPLIDFYGAFANDEGVVCGVIGTFSGPGRETIEVAYKIATELHRKYPQLPSFEQHFVNGPYPGISPTQAFLNGDLVLQSTGYEGLPEPLHAILLSASNRPDRGMGHATGRFSLAYVSEPDCGDLIAPAASESEGNDAGL